MELLPQYVVNGLLIGSTYAVVAVGFALTFSVLRVLNLAHPDLFMLAMFVGLVVTNLIGDNLLAVIVIAPLAVGLAGLVLERLVLRPLRGARLLMPLLATIGVSIFIQNSAQAIWGPDQLPFPQLVPFALFTVADVSFTSLQLVNAVMALVVLVGASFYVRRTRWGLATRAVAEKSDVSAAFGVNVTRVSQFTVALASVMAGVAGIGIAVQYGSAWAFVGSLYALKAFICVLVAGNRHIEAVMAVGLLLGVLEALTTGFISSSYRDVAAFVVLIAVLYFRPQGLFGSYE